MKRVYSIILLLLLAGSLFCQPIVNISSTYHAQVAAGGGGYSAEYQAVYDAITNKPTEAHADAQNTFVVAAKSHGYWDSIYVFQFYAQDSRSAGESLINWKNPGTHNGVEVSGIAWTTLLGYIGDGTADAIDMNYNPSTQGGLFEKDHGSYGVYVQNDVDENKKLMMAGANNQLTPRAGNQIYWRVLHTATSYIANSNSQGFYVAVRSNSTTIDYYKNGTDVGGGTTAAPPALENYKFYVGGHPDWYSFSTYRFSMAFVGGALSAQMVSDFKTDFEALMDALGTGVIP